MFGSGANAIRRPSIWRPTSSRGQWVWSPQLASSGPELVFVDLQAQPAHLYRNALLIGYSIISNGRMG